jgi:cell wall-associated NlpC family hydrolase
LNKRWRHARTILAITLLFAGPALADTSPSSKASSDYTYYAVHVGDTLESVSDHFESNPGELCRMNGTLKRDIQLVPGSILMVPVQPPPLFVHSPAHKPVRRSGHTSSAIAYHPTGGPMAAPGRGSSATGDSVLSRDGADTIYESVVEPVAKGMSLPTVYATALELPTRQNVYVSSSGERMVIPTAAPRHKAEPAEAPVHSRHSLSSRRAQRTEGLLKTALRFMGVPYVWGGGTPSGFDCSGFIQHVFSMNGIAVPRTADLQFEVGERVPRGEEQPGDVVFFETYCPGASHVGIYLGRHQFVHASSTAGHVTIGDLRATRFQHCYLGAKRIL